MKVTENNPDLPTELVFSEKFACPEHGAVMEELSPRLFSFNSPYGACPACHGIGSSRTFDPELIIPDPNAAVYHAIAPWSDKDNSYYLSLLYSLGQAAGFALDTPWNKLTPAQQSLNSRRSNRTDLDGRSRRPSAVSKVS